MATDSRPRTQAEWFGEQAYEAWQAGQAALGANDLPGAKRWLERACRFAPTDVGARLSLAVALLQLGDGGAASLFDAVAREHDVREAWLGLAAAQAEAKAWVAAGAALAEAFSRHVLPPDVDVDPLALRIARGTGAPGWCCVRGPRVIRVRLAPGVRGAVEAWLDGARLAAPPRDAPPKGDSLALIRDGVALLGSPLDLARMRRVEGRVDVREGAIEGWAWVPANPEIDPLLMFRPERGIAAGVIASEATVAADRPMARPRRFKLGGGFARDGGLMRVTGSDGRALPGSPVDAGAAAREAATVARALASRFPLRMGDPVIDLDARTVAPAAALIGPAAAASSESGRLIAVVVPVYRDRALTLRSLAILRETMPRGTEVIVIDDATPEPDLAAALDDLASAGKIRLLRHPENRGFPASANAGMRAAAGLPGRPDVVLLNSDALVTPGALANLRALVHAAPDIGTATPLSNDATILSYPDAAGGNPMPDDDGRLVIAGLAMRANALAAIDIPTAVGFCMYVRRECLEEVGVFRDDLFGEGYGEENDFCIRARHLGWRHVAAPGVFVAHAGGTSFGASRHARIARNLEILERLHPGYHALIADYQANEHALSEARRNLDRVRWTAGRKRQGAASAILITHDSGGGVERFVRQRCDLLRAEGLRPIVLRPIRDPEATSADERSYLPGLCEVAEGAERGFPNLRFAIPEDLPELARLLRPEHAAFVEVHHLLGHDHALLGLAKLLGVPCDVHVHDYAWFCPRITLLGAGRRYCGEPTDPAACEACIADLGRNDEQAISVADLRARSARDLGAARRVVVSCDDVARRLRRHFPAVRAEISALEDDSVLPPSEGARGSARRRVCVVGGIGPEKGYDVLLACARDAAGRALPLEFVVVGHTIDDARLLATGRVFVTGPYKEERAVEEIRAQQADIGFLPSIWPETWCYTLGHSWRAGLDVAAFDIGAPAERIRKTGRGWLLPLGLPPASVNNALLAARPVAGDECAAAGPA